MSVKQIEFRTQGAHDHPRVEICGTGPGEGKTGSFISASCGLPTPRWWLTSGTGCRSPLTPPMLAVHEATHRRRLRADSVIRV